MASIERRQIRGQERFLVPSRDPSGKQKARTFVSEKAAVDYEAEVRTDMRRGAYLDPQAGPTQDRQMKVATAQRRNDALDKEAEAARATAHRIEKEALATKAVAAGALRRLEASQLASLAADEAASRARLIVTLGEAEEALDNRKGK